MAWLTGWTRRKIKIVENLTASDYQMKLIIHKSGSGPDTSTDIYLGGHCRDDFADLRFTDPDQTTLLSYWIESITGTTPNLVATVWIKIPTLTPTNNIYIYYDSPSASSTNNGNATFIQWHGYSNTTFYEPFSIPYTDNIIMEASGRRIGSGHNVKWGVVDSTNDAVADGFGFQMYLTRLYFREFTNNAANAYGGYTDYNPVDGQYYRFKAVRSSPTSLIGYVNDTQYMSEITTTTTDTGGLYMFIYAGAASQEWSFIRKYASPEPSFGVSGTEELNITAIDMILNTNTCAGSCQIIAGVTWQNLGSSSIIFTPAILIDNTIIAYATSNITIGPSPATGSSTITTPTLDVGTHTICPYPN